MPLAQLARSIMCVGVPGSDAANLPLDTLRAFGPGGIILFARNVGPGPDLRAAVSALRGCANPPPLIAIDQEGGRVARIAAPELVAQVPPAMALAAAGGAQICEAAGLRLGRDLARLGISVDLAPCADLALTPASSVIGARSFGDRPLAVAACAAAFARGLERGGVAAALKHFPGHGATAIDSHLGLPRIEADLGTLRGRDLVPFAAAVAAEVASLMMTAHVVVEALDPGVPATLSAPILTGLLREQLGFDGAIVTDCLEMAAIASTVGTAAGAVRALAAGADLLLVSHDIERARAAADAIAAAVDAGDLPLERLTAAALRVGRLRERFAVPAPFAEPLDETAPLEWSAAAVTVVRGDLRLEPELPVSVISFEGGLGDGVAGAARAASLSAALRARRWRSELMRVALDPAPDDIDLLLAQLPTLGRRNFVVLMRRAQLYPAQRAAVERILAAAPHARLISAREPYDAALFPQAAHVGCIYGDEAISLAGCAEVLCGRRLPTGRLPVRLDHRDAALR